jgi:hypothetical protein
MGMIRPGFMFKWRTSRNQCVAKELDIDYAIDYSRPGFAIHHSVRRVIYRLDENLCEFRASKADEINSRPPLMNLGNALPDTDYSSLIPDAPTFHKLLQLAVDSVVGEIPELDRKGLIDVFGNVDEDELRGLYA